MGVTMEQIVVAGIVVTLSLCMSCIYLVRLRRAHRRQAVLSAAFVRARHARLYGVSGQRYHAE
jgi:hypothetical protein